MRLLIVEDDLRVVEALSELLTGVVPANEITICQSRDTALHAIHSHVFDYALLDRSIPTADGLLDAEVVHGDAVFTRLQFESPGTPVCFVSAFADQDFLTDLIQGCQTEDFWGSGAPIPIVTSVQKKNLNKVGALVASVKVETDTLEAIEIVAGFRIDALDKRVLRIFARRNGAASMVVERLSGGLSGSPILRAQLRDAGGAELIKVAARLGTQTEVQSEMEKYSRHVHRLPNGRFAARADQIFAGAGPRAGIFYLLIANFQSLATVTRNDLARAERIATRLEEIERNWTRDRPHSNHAISEIRQSLTSDLQLNEIADQLRGIDWQLFEGKRIQAKMCTQHYDLHCENVLVDGDDPVVIDYTEISKGPASLDPVTQLSLLFHPACRIGKGIWPTIEQAEHWDDIDAYVVGCPAERFVRIIRNWAATIAAGRRELYATAYAFAVRQLRYPDTDKELACAIMRCVIRAFDHT